MYQLKIVPHDLPQDYAATMPERIMPDLTGAPSLRSVRPAKYGKLLNRRIGSTGPTGNR